MTHTKRVRRVCKTPGHRICNKCDRELPATLDVFVRDSSRPLGIGYECKECHATRRKGRDRSKELAGNLNEEQKKKRRATANRYARSDKGKANYTESYKTKRGKFITKSYKTYDSKKGLDNDIDYEWFSENIEPKSCFYCDDPQEPSGCDRVDNSRGHLKDNVVPCCKWCNLCRSNIYTQEDMLEIGPMLRNLRERKRIKGKI